MSNYKKPEKDLRKSFSFTLKQNEIEALIKICGGYKESKRELQRFVLRKIKHGPRRVRKEPNQKGQ
jgi:hypothetical protein